MTTPEHDAADVLVELLNATVDAPDSAAFLSDGLRFGLKVVRLLVPKLVVHDEGLGVSISAVGGQSDGLFFVDEIRGVAACVTLHRSASSVVVYLGSVEEFDWSSRDPLVGGLEPICFGEDEIPEYVDLIADHFNIVTEARG